MVILNASVGHFDSVFTRTVHKILVCHVTYNVVLSSYEFFMIRGRRRCSRRIRLRWTVLDHALSIDTVLCGRSYGVYSFQSRASPHHHFLLQLLLLLIILAQVVVRL